MTNDYSCHGLFVSCLSVCTVGLQQNKEDQLIFNAIPTQHAFITVIFITLVFESPNFVAARFPIWIWACFCFFIPLNFHDASRAKKVSDPKMWKRMSCYFSVPSVDGKTPLRNALLVVTRHYWLWFWQNWRTDSVHKHRKSFKILNGSGISGSATRSIGIQTLVKLHRFDLWLIKTVQ